TRVWLAATPVRRVSAKSRVPKGSIGSCRQPPRRATSHLSIILVRFAAARRAATFPPRLSSGASLIEVCREEFAPPSRAPLAVREPGKTRDDGHYGLAERVRRAE